MHVEFSIRPMEIPQDYADVANLLSIVREEPVTVGQMRTEDARIPSHNETSFDEDGRLIGFCRERTVAVDIEGVVVGYAAAWRVPWLAPGNVDSTLVVHPRYHRLGVGGALLNHLESWARHMGASVLLAEIPDHFPDSKAFVNRHGYDVERHMFQSILDLASFQSKALDHIIQDVEKTGIVFAPLRQTPGQQVREDLVGLIQRTYADNPAADSVPPLEQIRDQYLAGDEDLIFIALDREKVVGMTQLVYMEQTGAMYNNYTCVDPAYRNRNIALSLNLLSLKEAFKRGVPYIRTDNDSHHEPMLAMNRKLGYRSVPGHFRVRKFL